MKRILAIIIGAFLTQSCFGQTQLPQRMPEKVSVSLHKGGGMSRSYKKITIEGGRIEFEELTGNGKDLEKWSAQISDADFENLYKIFVRNSFDTIKNDERKEIVYDAGSETISISINKGKSFNVTYGKNSPLSGGNLRRYQAVSQAVENLANLYRNKGNNDSMSESEGEKFIQGKWRTGGENDTRAWFLEWTFANGNFKQTGYPPILQAGKYRIVSLLANKLTLELYDQKGTFGENNQNLEIVINQQTNKLAISNTQNFSRANDVKDE